MAKNEKERWQFGSGNMEKILSEVAAHKGESLWQDAWRRLRRNKAAFYSLIFLILFGITSFIAPLLPIASPMALTLQEEPQPPSWPWDGTQLETQPGSQATSNLGSVINNGWRHRSTITFEIEGGGLDAVATQLSDMIEEVSGRTTAINRTSSSGSKPARLFFGVPNEKDDTPRTDWEETENEGKVTFFGTTGGGWLVLDLPVDEAHFASWSTVVDKRQGTFYLVPIEGNQAGLRYQFDLPHKFEGTVVGITFNGRNLPADGKLADLSMDTDAGDKVAEVAPLTWDSPEAEVSADEAVTPEQGPLISLADAPLQSPTINLSVELGETKSLLLNGFELRDDTTVFSEGKGGDKLLFFRASTTAEESQGTFHQDLKRQLDAALLGMSLPEGATATLIEVESEDAYNWEMNGISHGMIRARANLFGLWQTGNWMGTDSKGRDIFSRIIWGSRTSLLVAFWATLTSLLIGVSYGAFSGFKGGKIDNAMMRFVDILYSLPFIFVVIFLITLTNEYKSELDDLGLDREVIFYLVIGAIYWLTMARVVRGQVLSLKNAEFIEAARVLGASTQRILFVHLVPNVLSIVIVYLTLTIPAVMLFEAFLSFLGMGIEPPKVSWGTLAVDGTEAINPINIFWWLVLFPAMAMGSTLLALNILGDGLRDALDPKLRGKD
ncbi:MAG: oligopeptide transport system permease protein [Planctomycetota bacterium]|jgi:oligopeptide transport system permease protein